ncbi:hypothetical protein PFISCL1PPCAC_8983, partial [Pristionchus fissidentatus]
NKQRLNMSAVITFNDIPSEIISHICTFLSAGQRANLGRTSRRIREVELKTAHRKFGRISIVWTKEAQSVRTTPINVGRIGRFHYSVEGGNGSAPLVVGRDMAMYLRRVSTKELHVE